MKCENCDYESRFLKQDPRNVIQDIVILGVSHQFCPYCLGDILDEVRSCCIWRRKEDFPKERIPFGGYAVVYDGNEKILDTRFP